MQTRNTIQRQIVLQAVNQMHNHPTADAIYAVIAAQHPTISKATVYRNLNQLAAQGEILRVPVPTGADHFDFNIKPHYHGPRGGFLRRGAASVRNSVRGYLPRLQERLKEQSERSDRQLEE